MRGPFFHCREDRAADCKETHGRGRDHEALRGDAIADVAQHCISATSAKRDLRQIPALAAPLECEMVNLTWLRAIRARANTDG